MIRGRAFGKSSGILAVVRGVHLIGYGSRVRMNTGERGITEDQLTDLVNQERLCDHLAELTRTAGYRIYESDWF